MRISQRPTAACRSSYPHSLHLNGRTTPLVVVRGVPLHARAVGDMNFRITPSKARLLIKQAPLGFCGIYRKPCREACHDVGQDRRVGVGWNAQITPSITSCQQSRHNGPVLIVRV